MRIKEQLRNVVRKIVRKLDPQCGRNAVDELIENGEDEIQYWTRQTTRLGPEAYQNIRLWREKIAKLEKLRAEMDDEVHRRKLPKSNA